MVFWRKTRILKQSENKQVQRQAAKKTAPAILVVFFDFTKIEMTLKSQTNDTYSPQLDSIVVVFYFIAIM